MISTLHVYTLLMPLQIVLSHKPFVAVLYGAWEWIFLNRIMSLHMNFEIVAPIEELAAAFDVTLEVCILLRRGCLRPGTGYH